MNHQAYDQVKTEQWVRGLKYLAVAILVLALLSAGYALWRKNQESKALQAFSTLSQADLIEMRVVKESKVLSQDPVEALTEGSEADRTAYLGALEKVRADHKGTTASHLAALRLGRWNVAKGDLPKAEALYREALSEIRGRDSQIFVSMVSEALGVVLENQERWDDALKAYESGLSAEDKTLRPLLLLSKARVLSNQKKVDEAKSVYDSVVQEYPNSSYSQQARALAVKASL